jgi:hypothetical protein
VEGIGDALHDIRGDDRLDHGKPHFGHAPAEGVEVKVANLPIEKLIADGE